VAQILTQPPTQWRKRLTSPSDFLRYCPQAPV
jgi:hypothetical protein